jgi:hypothetical protein
MARNPADSDFIARVGQKIINRVSEEARAKLGGVGFKTDNSLNRCNAVRVEGYVADFMRLRRVTRFGVLLGTLLVNQYFYIIALFWKIIGYRD